MSEVLTETKTEAPVIEERPHHDIAVSPPRDFVMVEQPWGAGLDFDPEDLALSELKVMQGLSELVKARQAQIGEWRDASTGDLLAEYGRTLQVVIIGHRKIFFQNVQGVQQRTVAYDKALHEELPLFEVENNKVVTKRSVAHEFMLLVMNERFFESVPMVLILQSTQTQTAKKLLTALAGLQKVYKTSAANVIDLSTIEQSNDDGSWNAVRYRLGRLTTKEERAHAKEWYDTLCLGNYEVKYEQPESEPSHVNPVTQRDFDQPAQAEGEKRLKF